MIAEIGVNHNGQVDLAKQMITAAKNCGADAVKFQTFTAKALVTKETPKVKYQRETTPSSESHFEMIRRLELSQEAHRELFDFCRAQEIEFLSTPYDLQSARFLQELGVKYFKTASADIIDRPLQEFIAATKKPAIVATGMATLDEIQALTEVYKKAGNDHLVLLQCVSNYPCSDESLNLRVISEVLPRFGYPVGYSDHAVGPLAAGIAVAYGAQVVEKHFTIDKKLPGPDQRASSDPAELSTLIRAIRKVETMRGRALKAPQPEELEMAKTSRKSLVAARDLKSGSTLQARDLTSKRPGTGLSPWKYPEILGKRLKRDIKTDELLTMADFE